MVERTGKSFDIWYASFKGKGVEMAKLRFMEEFLQWQNISYEGFYKQYLKATRSRDTRDIPQWQGVFLNFYRHLRSKGHSTGYARNYLSTVTGFLESNGLLVHFTRTQTKEMSRKQIQFKDNFSKPEIRQLLASTTHPRSRAIVLALKDSGMSVGDLALLNISHLKKALDDEQKFTVIEYTRRKSGEFGTPAFGYESLDAIRAWLRWRDAKGYSCHPDSPLFVMLQFHGEASEFTSLELHKGVRMNGRAISMVVFKLVRKAGLESKKLSAHCFRIYNASSLESAGVNKNIVYRLQGRTITDSGGGYSKGEVLTSYSSHYDSLSIETEPVMITVPDEKMLEEMNVIRAELRVLQEDKLRRDKLDKTAEELLKLTDEVMGNESEEK